MLRSNNARGRIGLLASSSLVASTLMAGMGGVALTAFTPAVALASCTPTPAGTTAGAAANAQGVQTCGAGDPGVYYNATGNLNLDFTGEAVAPNGVGVTNGGAWNVILGINTTTETAGNIANTGGVGISLNGGTGGDVELDTGSAALGSFAGATVTGSTDGIDTSTGGAGTTKVNVYNTVTGASGNGISVIAGTGAVTVNAMTNTGGGVTVTGGGTAGISVFGGGAVTISAPGNTTGATYGIYSVLAGGPTTVTAGNTSGLDAIVVQNSAGDVTINSNGTATGGSQFIAISALTGSGNVTVTTKDVVNGIDAGGATNGLVTITTNGNVTGANGVTVDNGAGGGMAGSASVTLNGNVNNNATPTFYGTGVSINTSGGGGGITLTSAAGTDISSSNGSGVVLTSDTGNIVANLSGTVGGAEQVAGDGIDATTAVVFSKSTISITTAGVNAADNGIVASNGGSGFTSVTVNGNVTGASGVGIKATTLTENPANGTGADTVTLAGNVSVTAGGDGIDMSVDLYGNATLTLGANNTISAGGNGVDVQGFGTGAITIGTATKDDQSGLIQTTGFLTDGIVAQQGATATGGIDIDFGGNIEATGFFGGSGIVAEIFNPADTGSVTIRAGNISVSQGSGIFASTVGTGAIDVTTLKGTDISSVYGDGIDAFGLGGGDVTVTLLDGSIHSNTSGSAVQLYPSAGISNPTGAGPTGPSGPPDPHGVYMIAVADGTATLNQNSDVINNGPGAAILSTTVDGANTLNINGNVTNSVGDAIDAISSGNGVVTINLFNAVTPVGEATQTQNSVTISTTGGNGILAENTNAVGSQTALITTAAGAPGPLSVTVTGGLTGSAGVAAIVNGSAVGSSASVNLANAPTGSSISVDGAGANVGIEALAMDGGGIGTAGAASVVTGANLSVTVGAAGGDDDVGILAVTQDGDHQTLGAAITLGDANTITVGSAGYGGSVGVEAVSDGSTVGSLSGDGVSISGGDQDVITVTGSGSVGVEAVIGGGAHGSPQALNVSFGDGGAITVNDTAGDPGYGIYAQNNDADGGGSVSVAVGNTSISVTNGTGIEAIGTGNMAVSATSLGDITAGDIGIQAVSSSGDVSAGYNNTGTGSATMNYGGNLGVEAIATSGNASASVTLGNGVGQTTIHATNTAIVSTGVLASATGTGTASIKSNGNVTVDPTEFAQLSISPLGQAKVTTGLNDTNDVSDPLGVAPEHVGLAAVSGQAAGTASAVVTIADNNTISVTGLASDMSGSAGVAVVDDAGGDLVVNTTGAGGAGGAGLSITVGGDDSAGIVASTIGGDGTGGFYGTDLGSAGNVTVNTGTGQITVGGTDTTGVDANHNFLNGYGIFTATNGGDISVDNEANITVENGAGEGAVGIASLNTGSGSSTISLTNSGNISAGSVGIAAVDTDFFSDGNITINNTGDITLGGGTVPFYTVGNYGETRSIGILAAGEFGNVSVTNAGAISQAGYGIVGFSGGDVTVANSGNISAAYGGIYAFGSGTVLVNNTAATVNVSDGDGIDAYSFSGTVTVNQGNGSITAAGNAIYAQTFGSGSVTVNNNGTLTGTAGDGISAISGSGSVSVSSTGPSVTGGTDAIYAEALSGTVTVGTALAPITSVLGSAITTDAAVRTQAGSGTTTIVIGNTASMAADNNANYGIVANSTSGAINITNAAQIGSAGEGVNGVGILAAESGTGTTGVINIVNSGDIYAKTNGNFSVTVGSFGLTGTAGILAINNGDGAIDITNSGNIDPPAIGIGAVGFGDVDITNSGSIAASSVGISALSFGGSVSVDNTGPTINVSAGNGIDAEALAGSGSITVTQGTGTITANGTGIQVLGSGPETITSAGTITGVTGDGILANGGPGSIYIDTVGGGNVSGGTNGIVTTLTGGSGTTQIYTYPVDDIESSIGVTGLGGDGINATSSSTGYIDVETGNVTGQGAAGNTSNGIVASSTGGAEVYVYTEGNIVGDPTGNAGGVGATGITATTSGGNGSVYVDAESPYLDGGEGYANVSVTAGNYGIRASSVGTGSTTVYVNEYSGGYYLDSDYYAGSGVVTVSATGNTTVNGNLGPVGIWAVGGTGGGVIGETDGVDIINWGIVIAANGRGIVSDSGNNAEIDNYGAVVGLGDATHPVIDVTAPTGATTTIYNDGFIGSNTVWVPFVSGTESEAVPGFSDLAVRGTTGSVVIENDYYGFLAGRVDFSGVTGTNSVTIDNEGGEWGFNGVSTLAPTGNDTIINTSDGLIATSFDQAATTIVFGNMTNTFTNAGEFDVGVDIDSTGTPGAPAVTTLSGNLSFVNTGVVVLGAPYDGAGVSDRAVGAILDAPGAAWSGTGTLSLSANLWSTPQSAAACTSLVLTAGDCLIVGSTSGNTGIQVLDTQEHAYGAYNPTGIAIVVGSSAADTFHLASTSDYFDGNPADAWMFGGHTDVLDKPGLFFYDLAYNSTNSTEVLIGVPKASAFEFATFAGALDDVWYTTTQTWFDRTTDLRDSLQGRADGTQPAVWLKAVGDWTHRDQTTSFTDYNQTYTYNTSYDQDTAGLLGGVDLLSVVQKNQAWNFGIETGWVQTDLRFGHGSPDTFSATATDLGGYATYLSGGLFVDGVINANFLNLSDDLPELGAPPVTAGTHGTSWGGQVEAGYQMPIGASAFWEPVGSLSYVDTTFGSLLVPGGLDQMGGDTSFRGSLGARIGLTQDFQYYKVKFALTGRIWDEFENNPSSTLIVAGGPDFLNNDDLKGVFGEVSGQANLFTTTSGLSAFLTGGIKFKTDYEEGTVTIGARYQW